MTFSILLNKIKTYPKFGLVLLSYVAFIALGMPDGLLGVALPSMRKSFSVPLDSVGMLLATSVTGYLISSFFSGQFISRFGVGRVLASSCALTGAGLVCYTLVPEWWMIAALGITAGLGAGAIDAGLNSYAAAHFSEGLMQWLHASYGIGLTLGPVIMTNALALFNSWRLGYNVVGLFQIILALSFVLTLSMWDNKTNATASNEMLLTDYKTPISETLVQYRVWLSMLLFFLYTGSEASMGLWIYSLLTQSRGVNPNTAGILTGSFCAAFTIGRIAAGLYAKKLGVNILVISSLIAALTGAILLWWNPTEVVSIVSVIIIGLAIAPIFPAMTSGTTNRVGIHFAANTIGMQMAAGAVGVAFIPGLVGILADKITLEIIPLLLAVLFVAQIFFYSISIKYKPTL